jgi:vacuolar-type H+-ATPase subunit H
MVERPRRKTTAGTIDEHREKRRSFVALKALQDVQAAEQRAGELVEKTRLEGQSALQAVEKEHQEALQSARTDARKMIEREISGALERAREKIASLREDHTRALDDLRKTAEKNQDRAVKMVLEVLRQA